MVKSVNTAIVGAGQAGLALSYHLSRQGREHVILEKNRLGESWRSRRWDSFCLVTPNSHLRLPGFSYQGSDPDGFLPRDQIVKYLEDYAALFDAPVRTGVRVSSVERAPDGGYLVRSDGGDLTATNVVIAVGSFQSPRVPPYGAELPADVLQIPCGEYRNPGLLPDGAVLVVGSGQSGCQIAEELYQSGRTVYLCTGSTGRVPRRYRGEDITSWLLSIGYFDRTPAMLPSPRARFGGNPQLSGKDGGHALNLHQFARDGVVLLGHLVGANGTSIALAPDLHDNLARADGFFADIRKGIDEYIRKSGAEAPEADPADDPEMKDGYDREVILTLDPKAAGIKTVVWTAGFGFDFSWVHPAQLDEYGFPVQQRGVTSQPGLYFLGMNFLHTMKSGLLLGVGDDAAYLADQMASRP
jgi:putative flavoprotein involved in K+ transport